ncbi:unnamed protein product [Adineta ricciae]|uniref:G-protein coupled receptors family 1 profile domain-containing protein n=1 Tax=Adineta ricciae TaxID=249248 RepID=A0A815MYB5_ADIRI|nr:unnamed protein product [Adineta ricciae]CAF1430831.1 unnamed protein product [Adineta ricciae]
MSSQSSSSLGYITWLKTIQKDIYQIGGLILLTLGGISCLINIIIFSKKILRKNPCSIYLIAFNIATFLFLYSSFLNGIISIGFETDLGTMNLTYCRSRIYISYISELLTSYFLILASIDRVRITSSNTLTRNKSTCRLAVLSIIVGILICIPLQLHTVFFTNMIALTSVRIVCYYQPGTYVAFVGYYILIKAVSVPILLAIFGSWAIHNVRALQKVRTVPTSIHNQSATNTGGSRSRSKDRQLLLLLLVDIAGFVCFTVFLGVFLMYQQITQYNTKSSEQTQLEQVIRNVCFYVNYIPYCLNCYTHLFVSKTFRTEVKQLLLFK